ncbi:MAG: amidase [Burkholderiaceae bacterium]|nr:amidase [Burkholderiaceae bacterium]
MSQPSPFASATQLARLVAKRDISARELLELYLARVKKLNPAINAVVVLNATAARKRADALDQLTGKRGAKLGPLHGVPMTVKESFDVKGLPTTLGYTEHAGSRAKADGLAVKRLQDAGAVVFGKTNVPVALADWQSFNPVYGTTNNPWDVTRVPGGSSGGSAAALAAGLTGLEIGSDIGASIRNPAHYCGVYGHKPTFGVASRQGHGLPGGNPHSDISVIGPLARSAFDLETALSAMLGPGDLAARGWAVKLPKPQKRSLKDFRVAVMLSADTAEVDSAVQRKLADLAAWLRKQGTKVDMKARPVDPAQSHRVFISLLRSATSIGTSDEAYARLLGQRQLLGEDDDYRAQMIRATTMGHREWLLADRERLRQRDQWIEFFQRFDLLLCPAGATTAFAHNQQGERWERMIDVNGKPQPSTTQMFWAGYSGAVYLPSTVAPLGLAKDGLPVGVQIVAPHYGDFTSIRFAQLLEKQYIGFQAPPDFA